jgi:hypothetical protein
MFLPHGLEPSIAAVDNRAKFANGNDERTASLAIRLPQEDRTGSLTIHV